MYSYRCTARVNLYFLTLLKHIQYVSCSVKGCAREGGGRLTESRGAHHEELWRRTISSPCERDRSLPRTYISSVMLNAYIVPIMHFYTRPWLFSTDFPSMLATTLPCQFHSRRIMNSHFVVPTNRYLSMENRTVQLFSNRFFFSCVT